jgi:hypothetical protein
MYHIDSVAESKFILWFSTNRKKIWIYR